VLIEHAIDLPNKTPTNPGIVFALGDDVFAGVLTKN
jgi:hypothetical protein